MVASAERLPAAVGRTPRLPFRLARADLLKLRRRRGLVVTAALLTIGATIVMFVAFEAFHLSNSVKYGPAGGLDHFSRWVFVLSQLGSISAVLIGASAGADDLGAGVFRELVATGRSRTALFFARIPAGLAIVWTLLAASFALATTFTVTLAGSDHHTERRAHDREWAVARPDRCARLPARPGRRVADRLAGSDDRDPVRVGADRRAAADPHRRARRCARRAALGGSTGSWPRRG